MKNGHGVKNGINMLTIKEILKTFFIGLAVIGTLLVVGTLGILLIKFIGGFINVNVAKGIITFVISIALIFITGLVWRN